MLSKRGLLEATFAMLLLAACSGPASQVPLSPVDQASAHLGDVDKKPDEGCTPGKERWREQGAPKRGGTLVMPGLPLNLDYPAPGRNAMHQVYETLLKPRSCYPEDTVLIPGLAKAWTISPDGLTVTLKLRDDVSWQNRPPLNGRALTAADVVWTIENHRKEIGRAHV